MKDLETVPPDYRDCCVLGRAMNLHNQRCGTPDSFIERPVVQAALFVFSAISFFGLFVI